MSNQIAVIGTVATEPKEITTSTQAKFCTFRLASNERRYDREKNEWLDGPTNWFTINAFRSLGVHALQSFQKGDRIVLSGRLRVRHWEKDGKSGTSVEVEAEALGHDLRWGTSQFTKTSGSSQSEAAEASGAREATEGQAASETSSGWPAAGSPFGAGTENQQTGFENPNAGVGGFAGVEQLAPA